MISHITFSFIRFKPEEYQQMMNLYLSLLRVQEMITYSVMTYSVMMKILKVICLHHQVCFNSLIVHAIWF